jgi:hypothetical protein
MKFGEVAYEKGLQNFVTLRFSKEDMNIVLREYARLCGQPAETSIEKFWKHHDRRWVLRKLRRKIRRYTISQFERILEHKPF